jgi:hypothetical protein
MKVYQCMTAVSAEMAQTGISKSRKNEQQGYKFRGIEEVQNALAPLLARHGLLILPRFLARSVSERVTAKGGVLFNVVVDAEFDFVASEDGSKHTVRTFGEAMDSADKATNKAMSAAYKYAAFQAFCIPTEGDNDADAHTPDSIVPKSPDGYEDWVLDMAAASDEGIAALEKAWKGSKSEYRQHIRATNSTGWEALKARALNVVTGPKAVAS